MRRLGGVAPRLRRQHRRCAHPARARYVGHGHVSRGPSRQPLSPDAPRGVRPDLGQRLSDERRLRLRPFERGGRGVQLPARPPGRGRHPDHRLPVRRQRVVEGRLRRAERLPVAGRLGGVREGVPEPRAVHDARGPGALGQRRVRRGPAGGLRGPQGGRRARAVRREPRPGAARRAHRVRLPEGHDPFRGGVLPAPALRRAAARHGAHAPRERRPPAASTARACCAPIGTGPGSTRSWRRTSTASATGRTRASLRRSSDRGRCPTRC